jgi:hypothetical protein
MNDDKPNIFGREPVLILGLIQSALALGIGFGLNLDGQQVALIMAFSAAVLSVIARSKVSPV